MTTAGAFNRDHIAATDFHKVAVPRPQIRGSAWVFHPS
jgi:hypothetical protein